ncbi:pentatricopeptide repeat-containing protein At3g60050-like [Impatiens glandulifera]|uniref:pentatricopeptide repeat-containing protein At3g60050-like n=1 Tax=Impatiens glandulifera TaxID=253017 RepID=UPI001FB08FD1|nr:pentatricopeptide repeat-containing protein At3g60050-like [Impatiens glandulifera]
MLVALTMYYIGPFFQKLVKGLSRFCSSTSSLSIRVYHKNGSNDEYVSIDEYLIEGWTRQITDSRYTDGTLDLDESHDCSRVENFDASHIHGNTFARQIFIEHTSFDAKRVLNILRRDGPGFDTKEALSELNLKVSGFLVRRVLLEIQKSVDYVNKERCAKLAYKFFVWSGQQEHYTHTSNTYHLIMKIFADAEQFKAMWRLVDEMVENGFPATARTFNILICSSGEAGLAKKVVERFIKSKAFSYRPFKHSFNAILHCLLVLKHYKLIEWVYELMLTHRHSADTLTYNILMWTKYRLGKLNQFNRFLDEMSSNGFEADFFTFNLLLHVLGKGDKPLAALNLLNHMKEVGVNPCVLHFTTLIVGLSRAGNMDACVYFFEEMIRHGCVPDVVCYTVMITGYIAAGDLEKAQGLFDEMILNGKMPNAFTYNSMIRGLCMEGKFDEACLMLKEMESRGCNPNFFVYSTLVNNLRNAGKLSEAHHIIRQMVEKGKYIHLLPKLKGYGRY